MELLSQQNSHHRCLGKIGLKIMGERPLLYCSPHPQLLCQLYNLHTLKEKLNTKVNVNFDDLHRYTWSAVWSQNDHDCIVFSKFLGPPQNKLHTHHPLHFIDSLYPFHLLALLTLNSNEEVPASWFDTLAWTMVWTMIQYVLLLVFIFGALMTNA